MERCLRLQLQSITPSTLTQTQTEAQRIKRARGRLRNRRTKSLSFICRERLQQGHIVPNKHRRAHTHVDDTVHGNTLGPQRVGHGLRVTPAQWTHSMQESSLAAMDNYHNECKGPDTQTLPPKITHKHTENTDYTPSPSNKHLTCVFMIGLLIASQ